ncbi:DNA repair protein XRCC2 homolog isoform X2 [Phalaenopsis equestris]|uniref:DNA repair protein XRCC2 homolog isoform X2 n=1 Tax=Phalaenopsis equestris TaxID=78828 RepID=UPI0009E4C312|nr:DNA repair protein XRCC2 homolog isoform X2 [Phalaenopsis equestris]
MANPRAWVLANETAEQLFVRVEKERPALFLPPLNRIPIRAGNVGNVIEITGPSPSAKTEILLQAAIHCILPKKWNGVHFGGLERVVAYIDLDCRFDVLRLAQVLKLRILSAYGPALGTNWDLCEVSPRNSFNGSQVDHLDDELFLSCMKRFLYIRCYNSSEFLAALKTVHLGSIGSGEELGASLYILIIDSIGSFHWIDRACQTLTKDGSTREKLSLEKLTENVVQEINKIRDVQPLLVLASKSTIFGAAAPPNDAHRGHSEGSKNLNKHDRKMLLYREYMSPAWQLFVTHKVFLGISVSSDGKNGESPTYVCEWIQPPFSALDKFVNGICMVS